MDAPLRIDLNADLGEAFGAWPMGDDARLLPLVSSANVACGFHAGDPRVMDRTVALAVEAGVAVGAHPGYPDLRGFGRRAMALEAADVEADVLYQVAALAGFARAHGVRLRHVKPHGALYNQAAAEPEVARAVARGVARFSRDLLLVGLAASGPMRQAAAEASLRFAAEAFPDRRYEADGTLRSRRRPDAVLREPEQVASQAVRLAREGRADTLCLHGDHPSALDNARAVREALATAGIVVRALSG